MKRILLFTLIAVTCTLAEETCLELCSSCMDESKPEACSKVETLCKCSDIVEGLKREMQRSDSTVSVDSVQADSVADSIPQGKDSAAVATPGDSVVATPGDSVVATPGDSVVAPAADSFAEDPVNEAPVAEDSKKDKSRIFYPGLSLGFEQFQEKAIAGYDVTAADLVYDHMGINLGFLLRWYFYSAGSFQIGLNAIYHHGHYDIEEYDFRIGEGNYYYNHDVTVDYHSVMAEIPLTFRFGIPFVLSPYVSLAVHVRKPIYAWIDYDAEISNQIGDYYSYSSRDYEYDDYGSSNAAFTEDDWEFLGYLGFGLEITRHFSVQWQMLLINAVTYNDEILNYMLLLDTWRVSVDVAF